MSNNIKFYFYEDGSAASKRLYSEGTDEELAVNGFLPSSLNLGDTFILAVTPTKDISVRVFEIVRKGLTEEGFMDYEFHVAPSGTSRSKFNK